MGASMATPVATVPVPPRSFGNVGTGSACGSDNDCIQNHVCIAKNGGICATYGSCYNSDDCNNANNVGWMSSASASCNGVNKCSGVTCTRVCADTETMSNPNGEAMANGGVNPGTGTFNGNRPALKGKALTCPATNTLENGANCCAYIANDKIEASCLFNDGGTQCDCAGQNSDNGVSYCSTVGWNCRSFFSASSLSSTNGVVNNP